jgi:anti-sigma factor RsiW
MECKNCTEELTAYLDGELNRARFREVEGHLEGCLPCLEELESLKRSARLVELHLPELEPKPELWNHLTARIAGARRNDSHGGRISLLSQHRWLTPVAALAAPIVLAAGLWGLWNHQQSEKALRQYMSEYIQKRDTQIRAMRLRAADSGMRTRTANADHPEDSDNPFVEANTEPLDNPFRSEAQ